ncbi:MAG TPA: universal stress protein [Solirubrobacteraceae bacterium]|jgi:nucleotide-binding universal stress UspA family protein
MSDASPIVIAYDGSDAARAAVNEAAALFGARPAIVVTVWEPGLADYMLMPNTMGTGTMMMPYDPATVQAIDKAAEDHARDIAEDGAQLAQDGGLRAEALPVRDAADIADAILETASERDAAAIVIGSRGLKGLKSKLMGSSSASVLGRSDRPVVVVHAPHVED